MSQESIRAVAEACRVEHQILEHVKSALRVTLAWKTPKVGVGRKISSVDFTLRSFQRHLERIMELEEEGGYLSVVTELKPNLKEQGDKLREEHSQFRAALARIIPAIEAVDPERQSELETICDEIADLLRQIDEHDRREVAILQEAVCMDEGGEG